MTNRNCAHTLARCLKTNRRLFFFFMRFVEFILFSMAFADDIHISIYALSAFGYGGSTHAARHS